MTRHLKLFALCACIWSGVWLVPLYRMLHGAAAPSSTLVSSFVVFTVVLSSLEQHLRARDDQRDVRYNLPLRYSVVAAAASSLLTAGWALAWRGSVWFVVALGAASVLVILVVAHLTTRNRIKAYTKDDLFQ
jgi:asparagine N-glycosylation enzyme membrane subunit Stt3